VVPGPVGEPATPEIQRPRYFQAVSSGQVPPDKYDVAGSRTFTPVTQLYFATANYLNSAGGQQWPGYYVITGDKNAADPLVFEPLQQDGILVETCCLRLCQSVNTGVAQEHRVGKRHVNPGLGCGTFDKAPRTLQGDASLPRGHTGPVEGLSNGDVLGPNRGINQLFGVAAYRAPAPPLPSLYPVFATLPAKTLYEDR
jgi:hypothetical protein